MKVHLGMGVWEYDRIYSDRAPQTWFYFLQYGKKVACGSSEGTIYLFNWNGFGATSDRFALRAESIDCVVPVTESLLCTGSTDGVIR